MKLLGLELNDNGKPNCTFSFRKWNGMRTPPVLRIPRGLFYFAREKRWRDYYIFYDHFLYVFGHFYHL